MSTIADPDSRLLGEQVTEAMDRLNVPGVAVGILRHDRTDCGGEMARGRAVCRCKGGRVTARTR